MVHALAAANQICPDRPAKILGERTVTYAEYTRAVAGLARELIAAGAGGQRVAVVMANSIEASVASLACQAAGAQACLVNPNYTEPELTRLFADITPFGVLADRSVLPIVELAADATESCHRLRMVLGPGGTSITPWIDDVSLELPEPFPQPDDLALMMFTGGTTGVPKGANHTHQMLARFCRVKVPLIGYAFDTEVMLSVAPLFHIFGHHFTNLLPIYLRCPIVMVAQYKPAVVLAELEKHRCTVFSGGPASIYLGLIGNERFASTDLSSLRYSLSGGAPCPADMIRTWESVTGSIFLEGWAMTEGAPFCNNPAGGVRKLLSVGVLAPETELSVVDTETGTRVLDRYEPGELRVRGRQIMTSYHNRPEETANALRDGWMYTGDIGYVDDDDYTFIVDRKKHMLVVGGYNVYPREIEEVLFEHEQIHDAAVLGRPDDFLGEAPIAFVQRVPGSTLTADEVIAHCATQLVKYKVPTSVTFVESMPKTGANKTNRLALAAQSE